MSASLLPTLAYSANSVKCCSIVRFGYIVVSSTSGFTAASVVATVAAGVAALIVRRDGLKQEQEQVQKYRQQVYDHGALDRQ